MFLHVPTRRLSWFISNGQYPFFVGRRKAYRQARRSISMRTETRAPNPPTLIITINNLKPVTLQLSTPPGLFDLYSLLQISSSVACYRHPVLILSRRSWSLFRYPSWRI